MNMQVRKLLCPVDFSESSTQALQYAAFIAANHGATLFLTYVIEQPTAENGHIASFLNSEEVRNRLEKEAEKHLRFLLINRDNGPKTVIKIRKGKAPAEIIRLAKEEGIDLIVLGDHGTSKILMGNVAKTVSRNAPCPVLIVKSKYDFEQRKIINSEKRYANLSKSF